jgi:hypothetical protein
MGCLKLEILCYRLRILMRIDINNLEPTHLEDVYAMMGRSLYPNVMDG